MLGVVDGSRDYGAGETVHYEMESLVIVLNGAEGLQVANGDMKLLLNFADTGPLAGFAGFKLSSRELPTIFELSVSALGCKELLAAADDGCCT